MDKFIHSQEHSVIVDDDTNTNDDKNYEEETQNLSNALKNLLEKFSSTTNTGSYDEHLKECIRNWFSQHREFTESQIIAHLENIAHKNCDYASLLGFVYDKSLGTIYDPQKAFKWYLQAAKQNDAFGQNQVGYFYQLGIVTEIDHKKAFYWYQKSAENGCSNAKSNLGYCYESGVYVKRNDRYTLYWYSKSAEMGDELGKCNLAYLFFCGIGANADVHRALKLYLEAKNMGCSKAEDYICSIFLW
ncbi:13161_t:CDS:1 [Ambispora gerdemannii]|uniref:13161_t:CDS:1 n=1 Tax=Ambispora gerdemannii TaxID=144530 RepID=A0A9N9BRY8_9GLOM|nr:13161_t:CDS:1 [Ambispora gerdemannii]